MSEASAALPSHGRRTNGTFAPGHKFSKGNPHAAKIQKLRCSLLAAVSASNLKAVIKALIAEAEAADVAAAKLLFDRLLGPSLPLDMEARMISLEEKLETLQRLPQQNGPRNSPCP
jgi:hypothetical protein